MKKVICFVLLFLLMFCFYACCNDEEIENENNITVPTTQISDYILYGHDDQNIIMHKDIDFGTFENPHKIGESVRLRHSEINTHNKHNYNEVDFCDYNVKIEEALIGQKAEQKLKEICDNFDEEKFLLEENDLYLLKVKIEYNSESDIKDFLPDPIGVFAVNAKGEYVSVENRCNDSSYRNETENDEVSNWYPLFVPKGEDFKIAFAIGSMMEYPGIIAAVYYDI